MGARVLALVISLASVPLLVRYFGTRDYGVWATLTSFVALLNVADFGIGSGLLNAVATARGRDDAREVHVVVSTAVYVYAAIGAAIAMALLVAVQVLDWGQVFNVDAPELANAGRLAALTLGLLFAAGMPVAAAVQIRAAYQEAYVTAWYGTAGLLIGFAFVVVGIRSDSPMWVLALCVGGGTFIGYALNFADLFGWRRPALRPRTKVITRRAVSELTRAGILFFVLQIAGTIAFSIDNLVGAQVLGPEAVTRYAVPFRLFSAVESLIIIVTTSLWPAYSEALASGDMEWVRSTLRRSLKCLVALGAMAAVVLVLMGRPLIRLWVGPSVVVDSGLLLGLGCWLVLASFGHGVAAFLAAARVIRFQIWSAVAMASANLVLSVLLAREFGVAGLIWGTVIAYFVFTAVPYAVHLPAVLRKVGVDGPVSPA